MDRIAKLVDIEAKEGVARLYTLQFIDDELSEFEKFAQKFKNDAELQNDFQIIAAMLSKIIENGVLERYFRPEGKMSDKVCALPLNKSKLRLYCLRLTDRILVVGNGGEKHTKTYEESKELLGYVMDLQLFEKLIREAVSLNEISIEENYIFNPDDIKFDLSHE
jgi:hypothetical protein